VSQQGLEILERSAGLDDVARDVGGECPAPRVARKPLPAERGIEAMEPDRDGIGGQGIARTGVMVGEDRPLWAMPTVQCGAVLQQGLDNLLAEWDDALNVALRLLEQLRWRFEIDVAPGEARDLVGPAIIATSIRTASGSGIFAARREDANSTAKRWRSGSEGTPKRPRRTRWRDASRWHRRAMCAAAHGPTTCTATIRIIKSQNSF
jgi:hypothetical protein